MLTCETCRYFARPIPDAFDGECVNEPPVVVVNGPRAGATVRPQVNTATLACGEHRRRRRSDD